MAEKYQNFINGKWCDALNGDTFENRNPANWDGDLVGTFPKSGAEEVDIAVKAARKGFEKWRKVPAPERGDLMMKATLLMEERKEELSQIETREMGKVIAETRGDVQEGIDTGYFGAGESRRMHGKTVPSEMPNKFAMITRNPIGVCGLISPWNFPMAIPTWKSFPALMCGNSIVMKPASLTPATATKLIEIFLDAGFPPEVVNIVHGPGSSVGNAIVTHSDVDAISFTGSSEVGKIINSRAGAELKRVSLELGGKNAQIVMPDADLDLAVDGALWGAFGTTGQRCTATSRLILHEDIHDAVVEKLIARAKTLKIGDGLLPETDMGPVVDEFAMNGILKYIRIGQEEDGATLATGGHQLTDGEHAKGWFLDPTIFTDVKAGMRIEQEEIFGPVLSVIKIKSFEEAIEVLNGTEYGLSSSIYTNDVNQSFAAIRDIEAGITYVNGPTIGAECHLLFGGVKTTGNGHREGGWGAYEFFSEPKTVYVDYSGKLQRAQIDNR